MADVSTTTREVDGYKLKNMKENKSTTSVLNNEEYKFTIFDIVVIILSMVSIVVDFCTDLILVLEYIHHGHRSWALATFVLIFFPSIIVQTVSMRWHVVNKSTDAVHWVVHIFMCGIIHRYLKVLQEGLEARKSGGNADFQKLHADQSDLCILHLFESFLESAPQLVLQLYVIVSIQEWRFWTGISVAASLVSLAWALAAYTRAQRRARPEKLQATWPGLLLQACWRLGMLSARIASLVIFAYCFHAWLFLFLGLHWLGMTVWVLYQHTDLCDTPWEERVYNAVAGVIYCFCFFNLQEGRSRWRALTFYLIIIFQNLSCLTAFLMWFADKVPRLALSGFTTVVGGTLLGILSMLLYYRFFHPVGPITLGLSPAECPGDKPAPDTGTLRSLKSLWPPEPGDADAAPRAPPPGPDEKQLLEQLSPASLRLTDSIVVVEEEETPEPVPQPQGDEKYKRRAICSSVDLEKLMDSKEDTDRGGEGFDKELTAATPSEPSELSAHDYENLCFVNIAREAWGLRSWQGYTDIETWLHDDSVVRSRRGTLTSTSTSSSQTRPDDYLDTLAEDLALCESEYSLTLGTILEEIEESSASSETTEKPPASSLVATIEEIRLNTPMDIAKPRRKFSLIRERFEARPRHAASSVDKENFPSVSVASKISHWEQNARAMRDRSNVLLKQVLRSPPRFHSLRSKALRHSLSPV